MIGSSSKASQSWRRIGRSIALLGLLILGVTELFYGFIWGRLRIKAFENPMYVDLGLREVTDQRIGRAFNKYIRIFKDQWEIVFWFGVLTLLFVGLLMIVDRRSSPKE